MARPTYTPIAAGQAAWDGVVNDALAVALDGPLPIHEVADKTALDLLAPDSYDRCLAVTTSPPMLWISTGTGWVPTGIAVAVHDTGVLPAAASYTWTSAFPAGVRRIGVAGRVIAAVTGATSTNVGNHAAADPDMYAAAVAVALGTTFADAATADPGGWSSTAQDVVLTAIGGNFSGGRFRLYGFYIPTFAPAA